MPSYGGLTDPLKRLSFKKVHSEIHLAKYRKAYIQSGCLEKHLQTRVQSLIRLGITNCCRVHKKIVFLTQSSPPTERDRSTRISSKAYQASAMMKGHDS